MREDGGGWCEVSWAAAKSAVSEALFGEVMLEEGVEAAAVDVGGKPPNWAVRAEYCVRRRLAWSLRSEAELGGRSVQLKLSRA